MTDSLVEPACSLNQSVPSLGKMPLVIIAASAGGLGPITEILDVYPDKLPVATIIIQHLLPYQRSELIGLLQSHTAQRVHKLDANTALQAGNIYVIEPDTQIVLRNEMLQVFARDAFERPYSTIDVFLESVALRGTPVNVCVALLSGTGSDGSAGCRAVREKGGYVVVQQLADAKFDGMPLSVINSGAYDEVQSAKCMPERIGLWLEKGCVPPALNTMEHHLLDLTDEAESVACEGVNQTLYAPVFQLLRQNFDLDLNAYKIGTIDRRIRQRMHRLGYSSVNAYVKLLGQGGSELRTLFNDLMIGVTSFFRNPAVFDLLEAKVLPQIFEKNQGSLKFWVCACSTGEEAYSLALLVQKLLDQRGVAQEFRVFATDINPAAIRKAAEGIYAYDVLQPLIERFGLQDYVTVSDDQRYLRINPGVRRKIVFSVQNVLKHPPLHGLDMTLCRNMLIYLKPEAQRKVMANFIFGMKDGAVLVLGESEGPTGLELYFEDIDSRLKVFAKRAGVSLSNKERWYINQSISPMRANLHSSTLTVSPKHNPMALSIFEAAFCTMAGNSMIVLSDGEVQYITGQAGEIFTRTAPGRPTLSLHSNVADADLQTILQFGVNEALQSEQVVEWDFNYRSPSGLAFTRLRFNNIPSAFEEHGSVLVQMLNHAAGQPCTAVIVHDATQVLQQLQSHNIGLERLAQLERQNAELRVIVSESLQDKETFHEELQSANEELLSSNEELQSTNEELQSVNEELQSVNESLSEKIRLLTEADNDISNLLSATDAALLLLDENLHIRRFTQAALRYFPLSAQDHGRAIADLSCNLKELDISSIGKQVIASRDAQTHDVTTLDGKIWLQVIFKPYLNEQSQAKGVVMTLFDVTQMRVQLINEQKNRMHRELSKQMLGISYWELDHEDPNLIILGPQFYSVLGYETVYSPRKVSEFFTLIHEDQRQAFAGAFDRLRYEGVSFAMDFAVQRADGEYHWMMCGGAGNVEKGEVVSVVGMLVDINQRKLSELMMQEQKRNDMHNNRIFNIGMLVSGVAHELNNPLTALQLGCEQLLLKRSLNKLDEATLDKVLAAQQDAVRRMDSIVSSLLQFSRKESGDQLRLIHVADLLRDVRNLTETQAAVANVQIDFAEVPDHIQLLCNPLELAQALINLITNAIQAIAGLTERWVKVQVHDDGTDIFIRVIDAGLTANLSDADKLFTPFYTTKEVGRGTGLGLGLSQSIVESHGGTLRHDKDSVNMTFIMTLPSSQDSQRLSAMGHLPKG